MLFDIFGKDGRRQACRKDYTEMARIGSIKACHVKRGEPLTNPVAQCGLKVV
jgi:hypothetical protein